MSYVALRPMVLDGQSIQPGDPVDLKSVQPAVKRQRLTAKLIERKRILFTPDAPAQPKAKLGRPRKHPVEV